MTRGAGSSEDGPVGMARRILDSAEQELQEAIREAKEWGLNVDAIRFGEKILRDLKSISAATNKASPAGVSSSRAPVARPPKARPPPPPPMSQPTPLPTQHRSQLLSETTASDAYMHAWAPCPLPVLPAVLEVASRLEVLLHFRYATRW